MGGGMKEREGMEGGMKERRDEWEEGGMRKEE